MNNIFTSESVSEGHPDKLCDIISDAVLDLILSYDSNAHCACECFATQNRLIIGGEYRIKEDAGFNPLIEIDALIDALARSVIADIGYTNPEYGFDSNSVVIQNYMHCQSPDIEQGIDSNAAFSGRQGAGDQGIMFGYACRDTKTLMPAPVMLAHGIMKEFAAIRRSDTDRLFHLRPDAKSQVSVAYTPEGRIDYIDTIVVSHQNDGEEYTDKIKEALFDIVIPKLTYIVDDPERLIRKDTKVFINPTGRFVLGGPAGDTGLTGRKIIVDTYGGMGRHGGGAFSGKDPSKVDRSAAYMARAAAKFAVRNGLADRCEIQLSYAIGYPEPVSVLVDTFTGDAERDNYVASIIRDQFDFTPEGIVDALGLKYTKYRPVASYGHFGWEDGRPWENVKLLMN